MTNLFSFLLHELSVYAWLLVGLLLLAAELATPGLFVFIAFAGGCTFAACAAFYEASALMQCGALWLGTIISFGLLKKFFSTAAQPTNALTNIDALVGTRALVVRSIKPSKRGYVQVMGELWCARSEDESIFEQGSMVHIVRIEGNGLVVERI